MNRLFSALIFILLCVNVNADTLAIKDGKLIKVESIVDPKISWVQPKVLQPGMLIIRADVSDYAQDHVQKAVYNWGVLENGEEAAFIQSRDPNVIAIGATSATKKLDVSLNLEFTYELDNTSDDNTPKTLVLQKKDSIHLEVAPTPEPPSPPNPPTPPNPDVPLNDIAQKVVSIYNSTMLNNTNVDRNLLIQIAKGAAKNIREKTALPDDQWTQKAQKSIAQRIKEDNKSMISGYGLNTNITNNFDDAISDYLWEWYMGKNKQITVQEFKDVYNSIALGLENVK